MSDVWISRKTWTCKYCDVTINDDVPSRRQHEGGLRHKGNVERALKDMYKKSAHQRKEQKEHQKEIDAIEKAAQASHQLDLAHNAGPSSYTAPTAASGSSSAPQDKKPLPAWKPKDPYAAYTTASSLGFTEDPEVERRAQEAEKRSKEGVVGEWQVITEDTSASSASPSTAREATAIPSAAPTAQIYPPALGEAANARNFRVAERTLPRYGDDEEDEDDKMEIRVKKRIKMDPEQERIRRGEEDRRRMMPLQWAPVRLVKKEEEGDDMESKAESQATAATIATPSDRQLVEDSSAAASAPPDPAIDPAPDPEPEQKPPKDELELPTAVAASASPDTSSVGAGAGGSLFRKRKVGAGAGAKKVRSLV